MYKNRRKTINTSQTNVDPEYEAFKINEFLNKQNRRESLSSIDELNSSDYTCSQRMLFATLLTNPDKRAKVFELLTSEGLVKNQNENIPFNSQFGGKKKGDRVKLLSQDPLGSPVDKGQKKFKFESPSSRLRRLQLEELRKREKAESKGKKKSSSPKSSEDETLDPLPPDEVLKGVVAFCEVRSGEEDRSELIKRAMQAMGAEVVDRLNSKRITHVVYRDGSYRTFERARLLKAKLVSVLWIEACRKKGRRVDEKKYPALGLKAPEFNLTDVCGRLQDTDSDSVSVISLSSDTSLSHQSGVVPSSQNSNSNDLNHLSYLNVTTELPPRRSDDLGNQVRNSLELKKVQHIRSPENTNTNTSESNSSSRKRQSSFLDDENDESMGINLHITSDESKSRISENYESGGAKRRKSSTNSLGSKNADPKINSRTKSKLIASNITDDLSYHSDDPENPSRNPTDLKQPKIVRRRKLLASNTSDDHPYYSDNQENSSKGIIDSNESKNVRRTKSTASNRTDNISTNSDEPENNKNSKQPKFNFRKSRLASNITDNLSNHSDDTSENQLKNPTNSNEPKINHKAKSTTSNRTDDLSNSDDTSETHSESPTDLKQPEIVRITKSTCSNFTADLTTHSTDLGNQVRNSFELKKVQNIRSPENQSISRKRESSIIDENESIDLHITSDASKSRISEKSIRDSTNRLTRRSSLASVASDDSKVTRRRPKVSTLNSLHENKNQNNSHLNEPQILNQRKSARISTSVQKTSTLADSSLNANDSNESQISKATRRKSRIGSQSSVTSHKITDFLQRAPSCENVKNFSSKSKSDSDKTKSSISTEESFRLQLTVSQSKTQNSQILVSNENSTNPKQKALDSNKKIDSDENGLGSKDNLLIPNEGLGSSKRLEASKGLVPSKVSKNSKGENSTLEPNKSKRRRLYDPSNYDLDDLDIRWSQEPKTVELTDKTGIKPTKYRVERPANFKTPCNLTAKAKKYLRSKSATSSSDLSSTEKNPKSNSANKNFKLPTKNLTFSSSEVSSTEKRLPKAKIDTKVTNRRKSMRINSIQISKVMDTSSEFSDEKNKKYESTKPIDFENVSPKKTLRSRKSLRVIGTDSSTEKREPKNQNAKPGALYSKKGENSKNGVENPEKDEHSTRGLKNLEKGDVPKKGLEIPKIGVEKAKSGVNGVKVPEKPFGNPQKVPICPQNPKNLQFDQKTPDKSTSSEEFYSLDGSKSSDEKSETSPEHRGKNIRKKLYASPEGKKANSTPRRSTRLSIVQTPDKNISPKKVSKTPKTVERIKIHSNPNPKTPKNKVIKSQSPRSLIKKKVTSQISQKIREARRDNSDSSDSEDEEAASTNSSRALDKVISKDVLERRSTFEFETSEENRLKPIVKKDKEVKKYGTIVCTRLHRQETEVFIAVVKRLGKFSSHEDEVTKNTTHLVAGDTGRTVNLLRAIARGCWVVRHEWLLRSTEAGHWLPEKDYELTDFSPAVQFSRMERQVFGKNYKMNILQGKCIWVTAGSSPRKSDLVELIELVGGKIATAPRKADIILGECMPPPAPVCVAELWLLECISKYKLVDYDPYILNGPSR